MCTFFYCGEGIVILVIAWENQNKTYCIGHKLKKKDESDEYGNPVGEALVRYLT